MYSYAECSMSTNKQAMMMQGTGYDRESGMKWPIQRLRIYLQSIYGTKATIKLFHGIQEIVVKSLLAVQQAVIQDKHCFELYGYDVLVDEDLTPWLIEVQQSSTCTHCTFVLMSPVATYSGLENTALFQIIYRTSPLPLLHKN